MFVQSIDGGDLISFDCANQTKATVKTFEASIAGNSQTTSIRTTTSVFAAIGTTATTFATSIRTIFATIIKTKG